MDASLSFAAMAARVKAFIARGEPDEEMFGRLALELFALQFEHVPPYQRLCLSRHITPEMISRWTEIPAMPTEAFKEFAVTSLPPAERIGLFYSSGTTTENRSRHFHSAESLAVYNDSLLPWFQKCFLPDASKMAFLALTPPKAAAPNSSLVHMFDTISRVLPWVEVTFAGRAAAEGAWEVDVTLARRVLSAPRQPVALLGTAYSFVHLCDALDVVSPKETVTLPPGSRALETGGYKGRARELAKSDLHRLIRRRLGIHSTRIVTEYGMSELSSQAYDRVAGGDEGVFHFPPWARAQVISPETGRPAAEGEIGLLRVLDLANIRSVLAVQTSDLALARGDGFELAGRAEWAGARGCSLMSA